MSLGGVPAGQAAGVGGVRVVGDVGCVAPVVVIRPDPDHRKKLIADLVVGDRVLVQARVCKVDLKNDAMPALTASKVIAHPAKPANDQEDDD